ncbi:hypothetical protein PPERSA_06188 [Pseudocohnilembus persalinus]|uniref:Uncharacterized protein n=1 Tax=Pseudocohnilembus persalinus TaxID=266149 RepID=A0A0V0R148_PSEPJ|nr:hypothetical protein PPERSA_06188 [Pseudocohnilembus persalinus]|eukprot:KRX08010.1 hypothetical protein PPERSA_06188 [Pseudocohnilembus persalinus]
MINKRQALGNLNNPLSQNSMNNLLSQNNNQNKDQFSEQKGNLINNNNNCSQDFNSKQKLQQVDFFSQKKQIKQQNSLHQSLNCNTSQKNNNLGLKSFGKNISSFQLNANQKNLKQQQQFQQIYNDENDENSVNEQSQGFQKIMEKQMSLKQNQNQKTFNTISKNQNNNPFQNRNLQNQQNQNLFTSDFDIFQDQNKENVLANLANYNKNANFDFTKKSYNPENDVIIENEQIKLLEEVVKNRLPKFQKQEYNNMNTAFMDEYGLSREKLTQQGPLYEKYRDQQIIDDIFKEYQIEYDDDLFNDDDYYEENRKQLNNCLQIYNTFDLNKEIENSFINQKISNISQVNSANNENNSTNQILSQQKQLDLNQKFNGESNILNCTYNDNYQKNNSNFKKYDQQSEFDLMSEKKQKHKIIQNQQNENNQNYKSKDLDDDKISITFSSNQKNNFFDEDFNFSSQNDDEDTQNSKICLDEQQQEKIDQN